VLRTVGGLSAAAGLVLVASCAGASPDPAEGADEAEQTAFSEPPPETATVEPEGSGGANGRPVAIQLPGLPIGGETVAFTAPSTLCASIRVSGDPLPDGVQVVVRGFGVPPQFAVTPASCGGPSCLSGAPLSPDVGSCQVAVTWSGEPVEGGQAELEVTRAWAFCSDETLCRAAAETVARTGRQTVLLTVPEPGSTEPAG